MFQSARQKQEKNRREKTHLLHNRHVCVDSALRLSAGKRSGAIQLKKFDLSKNNFN